MELEVLSDFSEILPYPFPGFPLYAGIGRLESYNHYAVSLHFHPDFEFSLVLEGGMDYFVNGKNIHLREGDGIFVNSRRMHYNYSGGKIPCRYLVITISPELFPMSLPMIEYFMKDKTSPECSDYVLLPKESSGPILNLYPEILHALTQENPNLFTTLSHALSLCGSVLPLVQADSSENACGSAWPGLYDMAGYIHAHYREKITLAEIAAAGKVCRSRCCQMFTEYMGQSPMEYVIAYRLRKSREMLRSTSCPIGEVAAKCGFGGQSYFTQMFRKAYGMTPRLYRECSYPDCTSAM